MWHELPEARLKFNEEFPVGAKAILANFITPYTSLMGTQFMDRRSFQPKTCLTVASEYPWIRQCGFTTPLKMVRRSSCLTDLWALMLGTRSYQPPGTDASSHWSTRCKAPLPFDKLRTGSTLKISPRVNNKASRHFTLIS